MKENIGKEPCVKIKLHCNNTKLNSLYLMKFPRITYIFWLMAKSGIAVWDFQSVLIFSFKKKPCSVFYNAQH